FRRHAGIDILAAADLGLLAEAAAGAGIAPHPGDDWESLYFRIFLERIEPHLGIGRPTVLYDYPAALAALSRLKPADPRVAERFELYVCGLELANAFSELTDAAEQRARFAADQARKLALYGRTYPVDEDFLAALDHGMPPSAGIALGFDRLVMLAAGADRIDDVLWLPVEGSARGVGPPVAGEHRVEVGDRLFRPGRVVPDRPDDGEEIGPRRDQRAAILLGDAADRAA